MPAMHSSYQFNTVKSTATFIAYNIGRQRAYSRFIPEEQNRHVIYLNHKWITWHSSRLKLARVLLCLTTKPFTLHASTQLTQYHHLLESTQLCKKIYTKCEQSWGISFVYCMVSKQATYIWIHHLPCSKLRQSSLE